MPLPARPSRTRWFCGHRLTLAPGVLNVVGVAMAIVTPTVLFFVFTAPFYAGALAILPALWGVLVVLVLASLLATWLTDPGIIPRAPAMEEADVRESMLPLKIHVQVKEQPIECRYCQTCHMHKRPRSTHCSVCNNCVDCPFVGNCIARRNYRFFLVFVTALVLAGTGLFFLCLGHLIVLSMRFSVGAAIGLAPISLALVLYAVGAVLPIIYLNFYHCTLLAEGLTTNEQLNYKYRNASNPFKRSLWPELAVVLCGGRPPSYVRWRSREDDWRLAESQSAAEPGNATSLTPLTSVTGGELAVLESTSGLDTLPDAHVSSNVV